MMTATDFCFQQRTLARYIISVKKGLFLINFVFNVFQIVIQPKFFHQMAITVDVGLSNSACFTVLMEKSFVTVRLTHFLWVSTTAFVYHKVSNVPYAANPTLIYPQNTILQKNAFKIRQWYVHHVHGLAYLISFELTLASGTSIATTVYQHICAYSMPRLCTKILHSVPLPWS